MAVDLKDLEYNEGLMNEAIKETMNEKNNSFIDELSGLIESDPTQEDVRRTCIDLLYAEQQYHLYLDGYEKLRNEYDKIYSLYSECYDVCKVQQKTLKEQNALINIQSAALSVSENTINNFYSKSNNTQQSSFKSEGVLDTGFVYIIKDIKSNYHKIGKSRYLEDRLKSLTTGNPNIIMIASRKLKQFNKLEKHLHRLYKNKNVKNEWFNLNDVDLNEIVKTYKFNLHIKDNLPC